jgi:hypothetical protein
MTVLLCLAMIYMAIAIPDLIGYAIRKIFRR